MATKKKEEVKQVEVQSEKTEEIPEAELQLIEVAQDLNNTLDLEPPIDTDLDPEDLLEAIKEQASEVLATDNPASPPAKNKKGQTLPQLSPETWAFLEANDFLAHLAPKKKEEPKKAGKKPDAKKEKKSPGKGNATPGKGPGIIAAIVAILTAATKEKPVTKGQILEKLTSQFPDRDGESMKNTINVQIPARISKEKGLALLGDAATGFYTK